MNVIWAPLSGTYLEAAELICEKYDIRRIYLFMFEENIQELRNSKLEPIIAEIYQYMDMMDSRYEKYIWYDTMKPLDVRLLDRMSVYEPEALKMLERVNGNDNPAESRFMQYHMHVRYWDNFLDKANIDFFIANATPHACYDYILMRLCQARGIPVIQVERTPIQVHERLMMVEKYELYDEDFTNRISRYKLEYKNAKPCEIMLPEDIEQDYCNFMGSDKQIVPTVVIPDKATAKRIWLCKQYAKRSFFYAVYRVYRHYIKQWDTLRLVKKYERLATKADFDKEYIYFPMHIQPELSTSPRGGWYVHQYLAIEMLSYYVPKGMLIYVREHPSIRRLVSNTECIEHIERISKLKNVRLISMKENGQKLLKRCTAVASITGSVGYEALYLHKPYIMFGDQVMKYGPGTLSVRNNEDCLDAIKKIVNNEVNYDDKEVRIFLKVLGEKSTHISCINGTTLWEKTEENIRAVADMFSMSINKAMGITVV